MTIVRRGLPTLLVLGFVLAVSVQLTTPGSAHAYGKADQPVAQIEFSGNCDTPTAGACDLVGGTGGIWLWIELDANGTGDIAGSGCFHTVGGVGGPGGAGAVSIKGEITWTTTTDPTEGEFFGTLDPNGMYYLVTIPGGEVLTIPMTQGHYAKQLEPGFQLQIQVAP